MLLIHLKIKQRRCKYNGRVSSSYHKKSAENKKDMQEAVLSLIAPLAPYYSEGGALLQLDNTGAHYFDVSAYMEGFSRVLWGLAPLVAGGGDSPFVDVYLKGFANGTKKEQSVYQQIIGREFILKFLFAQEKGANHAI